MVSLINMQAMMFGEMAGKGHKKTLVVVYQYAGLQMLDVVKEHMLMNFIASPPMTIIGAAYGLANVTTKVCALVKNRSLTVTASNKIFGDADLVLRRRWSLHINMENNFQRSVMLKRMKH